MTVSSNSPTVRWTLTSQELCDLPVSCTNCVPLFCMHLTCAFYNKPMVARYYLRAALTSAPLAHRLLTAALHVSTTSGAASLNQSQKIPSFWPCSGSVSDPSANFFGSLTGGTGPRCFWPAKPEGCQSNTKVAALQYSKFAPHPTKWVDTSCFNHAGWNAMTSFQPVDSVCKEATSAHCPVWILTLQKVLEHEVHNPSTEYHGIAKGLGT